MLSGARAIVIWLVMAEPELCMVRKTIKKLPEWCTNHAPHPPGERAIDVLKAVYRVCDSTFGALVHTVTAPEVSLRAENYTVETQLCGPPAKPSTAEVKCWLRKLNSGILSICAA